MLFDEVRIILDVKVNIIRQLDPARRADRYALYSCLLVSRSYFELAVERLWSRQVMPTTIREDNITEDIRKDGQPLELSCNFLLQHALDTDPPASQDDRLALNARDRRMELYFRSVRAIKCTRSGSLATPTPQRILAWLSKLDWIDLSDPLNLYDPPSLWLTALTEWAESGDKGHRLRRVQQIALSCLSADDAGKLKGLISSKLVLLKLAGSGLPELVFMLTRLSSAGAIKSVRGLCVRCLPRSPVDHEALGKFIISCGAHLRRLEIGSNLATYLPDVMLAQVIAAATHLTQIDMLVLHQNSCDYVSGLLQASRATLSDVTLHIETVPYLSLLPIRKLSHLETLKLNFGFDLVGDIQLRWLKTMQSLRKLSINARNWEFKHLEALLEDVEIISVLELHIQLRDCLDDNEDNHLSVTFANLREVSLKWSSKAGLSLKGFEGGLPFLEDISIQVHFFADSRSTVERKLWELKESFMRLVEVSMSLSLAYAIIKLGCDDVHYDTWRWRAVDHYAEE